jgi:hypothetical protein
MAKRATEITTQNIKCKACKETGHWSFHMSEVMTGQNSLDWAAHGKEDFREARHHRGIANQLGKDQKLDRELLRVMYSLENSSFPLEEVVVWNE